METLILVEDVHTWGARVSSFPKDIGEAFDELIKAARGGDKRSCYGISYMDDAGGIFYFAAIEEQTADDISDSCYQRYTIPRGQYLAVTIQDWRQKTDAVKDVFNEMMQDERFEQCTHCIEWYKDDREMVCMLQANPAKTALLAIRDIADELADLLLPLTEAQMNTIPFEGSWTAAQLASHITKSNVAMAQGMQMPGVEATRNPAARAEELRDTFLNFSIKFSSPSFIVPEAKAYSKTDTINLLHQSNQLLQQEAAKINTAAIINLPALGEMTKLELLHFVLYHTQRHIHQLKNILLYV
jgi:predicted transcriptional regulator YdeE